VREKKVDKADGEEDDTVLVSSEECTKKKKRKAPVAANPQSKKKAAKSQKSKPDTVEKADAKGKKKLLAQNQAAQGFATKAIVLLSGPVVQCQMALDTANGSGKGLYPPKVVEAVEAAYEALGSMKHACVRIASMDIKSCSEEVPVGFDQAQMRANLNAARDALMKFTEMQKIVSR